MPTTVGDIVRSSMRKIGVLAAGEPLPSNEGNDALVVFRQMIDAWTNETLLIPIVSTITKTLFDSIAEYKIGVVPLPKPVPIPDDTLDTARPEKILAAFIRDGSGTDYIQEIIEVETYSRISRKTNVSRPSRFYVRKGWPYNTILFESLPYNSETLHLEVVQPLSEMLPAVGLTEEINLPPGYERALTYNLCLELAPEWGKEVPNVVAVHAVEGKKWLKRNNYRKIVLGMDRAVATQRRGIGTYIIEQGP